MLIGKDKMAGHSKKSEAMRESQVCQRVASRTAQHVEGRISICTSVKIVQSLDCCASYK